MKRAGAFRFAVFSQGFEMMVTKANTKVDTFGFQVFRTEGVGDGQPSGQFPDFLQGIRIGM